MKYFSCVLVTQFKEKHFLLVNLTTAEDLFSLFGFGFGLFSELCGNRRYSLNDKTV